MRTPLLSVQRNSQMLGGLLLSAFVAALSMWLAQMPTMHEWGLSALTLAIMIGMLLGNSVFLHVAPYTAAGIDFSRTRLLRAGIVLYGFRITLLQIMDVGWQGLMIDLVMLSSTFLLAIFLGRRVFKVDPETTMLIGAGASICGAAAVMGAEPVVRAPAHKVSVAVATVVVFGTLSMFLYPLLYPWLGFTEQAYGIYVGSTVHEVAQVVVAGSAVSQTAAATAVIEKMLRVMLLAPFLLVLSWWLSGRRAAAHEGGLRHRVSIPWFVLGFIAVSAFNTLALLPESVVRGLIELDTLLLAMAMGALGMRTHAGAIRQAGVQPLMLAAVLFVFLIAGGYVVNRGMAILFA